MMAMTAQAAIVFALTFFEYGFDHRSRHGLDYDHFVCIGSMYLFALAIGISAAIWGLRMSSLAWIAVQFILATAVWLAASFIRQILSMSW